MAERRYSDEEVEQIFRVATAPGMHGRDLLQRSGPTLAELQEIGREVGVAPARITEAALSLDHSATKIPPTTVLGMPISVGQIVELPRAPTDREWAILVGKLREIFQAHGVESTTAVERSWQNGNLQIVIEPTEQGYRLRMGTRNDSARVTLFLAPFFLLMAALFGIAYDGGLNEIGASIVAALVAFGSTAFQALHLPGWAAKRNEQMEFIAARTLELLARTPGEASGTLDKDESL
jgi:hypothetical protein